MGHSGKPAGKRKASTPEPPPLAVRHLDREYEIIFAGKVV